MNYRNPKLLQAARNVPNCMGCGKVTDGTIVMAHANWSEYGKGMGIKAHDWAVAALCHACHASIDSGKLTRQEKRDNWLAAHIKTLVWLFDTGIVR